jgi:hypothetical protein
MNPPRTGLRILGQLRQMVAATARLAPLVLLILFLAAMLWRADLAATTGLFQSPPPTDTSESPLPTPTPFPATSTPVPTARPTLALTDTPSAPAVVEPTATESVAPTPMPTTVMPTEVPPTETALPPTPTATFLPPTLPPPTVTPVPRPTNTVPAPEDTEQRYPEGDSNLKFEWGMLFDSVALGLSYVWLCCGGLVLLGIPALFVALWVASKRRQGGNE